MHGDPRPVPRPARARTPRRPAAALLAVVLLGALGACGGGEDEATDPAGSTSSSASSSASATPEVPSGTPACADVWSEGAKIPRAYAGCVDDGGSLVPDDSLGCSSGQRLVTFDDRFYGVAGGEVRVSEQPLADDRDYGSSVRSCRA